MIITILVRFLTIHFDDKKDEKSWADKLIYGFCLGTIWPLMAVLIGFIVSKFI